MLSLFLLGSEFRMGKGCFLLGFIKLDNIANCVAVINEL
jgi:hypothetical protein